MGESSQAYPPRFWWLKRLAVACVVLLVLLVCLRLWWGSRADARLEAVVAEIESKGEPIRFEDMRGDPVPDDRNKVYYLRQAYAQWPLVPGQGVLVTETDWDVNPYDYDDPITDNEAYLSEVKALLPLFAQAKAAPASNWGVQLQSPAYNMLLPNLGEARRLARLLSDAASRAGTIGDNELAMLLIACIHTVSDALDNRVYFFIHHLVDISIDALAYGTLEDLLPGIPLSSTSKGPVREQLESLKTRYLDESDYHAKAVKMWIGERWGIYDTTIAICDGRVPLNQFFYNSNNPSWMDKGLLMMFRPIYVNDTTLGLEMGNRYIDAAERASGYTDYHATITQQLDKLFADQELDDLDDPWFFRLHPITSMLMPVRNAAMNAHFRVLARRRMAATVLAIKLYEADHGTRPDSLEALVPEYLPSVPLDPFASPGTPIGYLPGGCRLIAEEPVSNNQAGAGYGGYGSSPYADYVEIKAKGPAVVYSVDQDGVDNGGIMSMDSKGEISTNRKIDDYQTDLGFLLDKPEETYPYEPVDSDSELP